MHMLGQGEHSVGEIASSLDNTPSNVSQHLRIMRNLGLVRANKKGTQVYYGITSKKFVEGYRLIREGLAEIHFSSTDLLFPEDRVTGGKDARKGGRQPRMMNDAPA